MTAKDALVYLQHVPPDEPVFIIRGQDVCAGDTVHFWTVQAQKMGAPQAKLTGALEIVTAIRKWPVKKVPD